jgi:hypothetical protein
MEKLRKLLGKNRYTARKRGFLAYKSGPQTCGRRARWGYPIETGNQLERYGAATISFTSPAGGIITRLALLAGLSPCTTSTLYVPPGTPAS